MIFQMKKFGLLPAAAILGVTLTVSWAFAAQGKTFTGTVSDSCSAGSAAEVAALQATTISFTPVVSTVHDGFSLQLTPRLLDDGRILLQYSLSLIGLDTIGATSFK